MTTYPYILPSTPTPYAVNSLLSEQLSVLTWVDSNQVRWPLSGGLAPVPGAQNGVTLKDLKGPMSPFTHIDLQSARQDGVTWQDTVWEPMEMDLTITMSATDPTSYRNLWKQWVDGWNPRTPGRLSWFTSETGEWWAAFRLLKETQAVFGRGMARHTVQEFDWTIRSDTPWWQSFPSVSQLVATSSSSMSDPAGINNPNFLFLYNRGNQNSWPTYVIQGPGSFTLTDIGGAPIPFGPLAAGQQVLIVTLPMLRAVQQLNGASGNLYPLLGGRFSTPLAPGGNAALPIAVTGATSGVTSIVGSIVPYRDWPE